MIEMRDLEKLTGYEVEVRKEYVRSAYKKIVFDKEIVKRAVILRLKERETIAFVKRGTKSTRWEHHFGPIRTANRHATNLR